VQKGFTPALVQSLTRRVEQITEELLDRMQGKSEVDLIADFALPLPMTVISEMLGVPEQERMRFRHYARDIVQFRGGVWGVLRRVLNRGRMVSYFNSLIDYRRKNPDGQLISLLVQAEQSGDRLSSKELVAMVFLLLFAGHETTVNLIGNGMLALLENPDQFALLRDRPELARTAVEELLRFTNPVEHGMPRITLEEVEIRGVKIPPHSLVLAMLSAANRDPAMFTDPEKLDITRDSNRHLALGIGIHYCLGAPLARLEGAVAFNALLRRFPNMQLAVARDQIRWRPPSLVRGLEALPVRLNG
jgi:cytochrome P450